MRNFGHLDDSQAMLASFFGYTYDDIFNGVQNALDKQVAGSVLRTFAVTSSPEWLTRIDSSSSVVKASGVAFEFASTVYDGHAEYDLTGVYMLVGHDLNGANKRLQMSLDIDGILDEYQDYGLLYQQVYAQ